MQIIKFMLWITLHLSLVSLNYYNILFNFDDSSLLRTNMCSLFGLIWFSMQFFNTIFRFFIGGEVQGFMKIGEV